MKIIILSIIILITIASIFWHCFKKRIYKNKVKDGLYCELDSIASIIIFVFLSIASISIILNTI